MIRNLLPFLAVLSACAIIVSPAAAADARRAMDEGFTLFAAGSYDAAAKKFEEAAAAAGNEGLDPSVPRYNGGISLLKAGKLSEASAALAEALRSAAPGLRERAHYNHGIALATAAEALERRGETAGAVKVLGQALEAYESAMRTDPRDEDPKVNHELVSRRKAQLEQKLKEQAGGGKARQDELQAAQRPEETNKAEQKPREQQREMTQDEVRMMLEAMKQQEISQRNQVRPFRGAPLAADKNW